MRMKNIKKIAAQNINRFSPLVTLVRFTNVIGKLYKCFTFRSPLAMAEGMIMKKVYVGNKVQIRHLDGLLYPGKVVKVCTIGSIL